MGHAQQGLLDRAGLHQLRAVSDEFAKILAHSTLTPTSGNYSIWVQGMGNATGSLVQNPTTSVDSAVNTLSSYVSNQLGSSSIEKLP